MTPDDRDWIRYQLRQFDKKPEGQVGPEFTDEFPGCSILAIINIRQRAEAKMAATVCKGCGCATKQFPWLLDRPSLCQICERLGL